MLKPKSSDQGLGAGQYRWDYVHTVSVELELHAG